MPQSSALARAPEVSDITEKVLEEAGLRYVDNHSPGIRRRKKGKGFFYIDAQGHPLQDEATKKRIASLVIPPGWTEVWVCPAARGHVQARRFVAAASATSSPAA